MSESLEYKISRIIDAYSETILKFAKEPGGIEESVKGCGELTKIAINRTIRDYEKSHGAKEDVLTLHDLCLSPSHLGAIFCSAYPDVRRFFGKRTTITFSAERESHGADPEETFE